MDPIRHGFNIIISQEDLGVKKSFLIWYNYAMTEAIISDVLIPIGVFIYLKRSVSFKELNQIIHNINYHLILHYDLVQQMIDFEQCPWFRHVPVPYVAYFKLSRFLLTLLYIDGQIGTCNQGFVKGEVLCLNLDFFGWLQKYSLLSMSNIKVKILLLLRILAYTC